MKPNPLLFLIGAAFVAMVFGGSTSKPAAPSGPSLPPSLPPTGSDPRALVVAAALSQVGLGDAQIYWDNVLPGVNVGHADWCGAFALWCLHQAGLALDRHWVIGSGFLLTHPALPQTKTPQVGDIAYFAHNEHHGVIVSVDPTGAIGLVNGNGTGGLVSQSTVDPSEVTAFFSIAPLIAQVAA